MIHHPVPTATSRRGPLSGKVAVVTGAGRGIGRAIALGYARAAIPHLRRRGGGKILVMGSGTRMRASAGQSAYAASKLAVWMLTQTLAVELQDAEISVNELIPGPVKTALTGHGQARFPAGEWIKEPEDVVPLALHLATQPARGPTAQSYSLMRRSA
ncbi:MAG: SDR family NAD(P)-dependent oxidoreductase [Paraburkholderia sp.]|jgi:3-oxoacyl-[acyl-carrier protein] reductase|nr:SDR family NAD(P)-dependent oxidoreductase [Paraburkholderia sp.]